MAGMVVIYKKPADVKAFEKHYFETHIPLAKMIPGLRKYEISHGPRHSRGRAVRCLFDWDGAFRRPRRDEKSVRKRRGTSGSGGSPKLRTR